MNRLIRKRRRVYLFVLHRNATDAVFERHHRSSRVDHHDQHGRPIYLEVIALSSHRGRVRVGEVRAMITVHYAVHVAHVHQLAGTLHARHAHTRAESVRWARSRASCMCDKYTHTLVSPDIPSSNVIYGCNSVEIRIRVSLRDIASGSDGHSRPRRTRCENFSRKDARAKFSSELY